MYHAWSGLAHIVSGFPIRDSYPVHGRSDNKRPSLLCQRDDKGHRSLTQAGFLPCNRRCAISAFSASARSSLACRGAQRGLKGGLLDVREMWFPVEQRCAFASAASLSTASAAAATAAAAAASRLLLWALSQTTAAASVAAINASITSTDPRLAKQGSEGPTSGFPLAEIPRAFQG